MEYRHTIKDIIVTDAEMDLSAKFYESEEGKCYCCKGTGQEYYGWSRKNGKMLRTCTRCGGSGRTPNVQEEDNESCVTRQE
jgi:DnaJ-class molecular chaperone